jgi:hypothetical protein
MSRPANAIINLAALRANHGHARQRRGLLLPTMAPMKTLIGVDNQDKVSWRS